MMTYIDLKDELEMYSKVEAMVALADGEYLSKFDVTEEQVESLYGAHECQRVFTKAIDDELMETIATYMDSDIREQLHGKGYDNEQFLYNYITKDVRFIDLLKIEFDIEMVQNG